MAITSEALVERARRASRRRAAALMPRPPAGLASSASASSRSGRMRCDEPAVDEHLDRVGPVEQLLQVGRDQDRAAAGLAELVELAEELGRGRDVEAARRVVEDEQARRLLELAPEHEPLLVAAAELRARVARGRSRSGRRRSARAADA